MTKTCKENNNALANLNDKLSIIKKDIGILASYLFSPPFKITNPEHTSHYNLVNDLDWNRVKELLINKTLAVTLFDYLLTFRETDEKFELEDDLL